MPEQSLGPMMQQYLEIKSQHPDEIVFYRLGDFYEMFFDDAITGARELELTLTHKKYGNGQDAPMCGVPFHAYEGYLSKLLSKGYKVAICEQTEDPAKAKKLVQRDVVRVVTPGTVIESSMLQEDKNNYLCSIYAKHYRDGWRGSVCFADVSTGKAQATEFAGTNLERSLIAEISRFAPSEFLLCSSLLDCEELTAYLKQHNTALVNLREDACYKENTIADLMTKQFGPDWRAAYEGHRLIPRAVGALLAYLRETQKHGLERLEAIDIYEINGYLHLSVTSRAHLELTQTMRGRERKGTLLWVLDATKTNMGRRLLRSWVEQPLVDCAAIDKRLDAVAALHGAGVERAEMRETLDKVADIERLATRILYGSATPREVKALGQTCAVLPAIKAQARKLPSDLLQELSEQIDPLSDLREWIDRAIVREDIPAGIRDGGVIAPGYDPQVDELRDLKNGSTQRLAQMESQLREKTGIAKLRIGYNRVFGYYIEVGHSYTGPIPADFTRRQTLTTGERYITPELKELESKVLGANDQLLKLEHQLYADLLKRIAEQILRIQASAEAVATLDVLASLAHVAVENHYTRPVVDRCGMLEIRKGRHPVIEKMLPESLFVPNDTMLGGTDDRLMILTGPNMAGKSTYMRQNALIVLMAQMGSFVPAAYAHVGVVDAIFTRVGASDDLGAGQSTFMVEMTEVAEILRQATSESLVILDEIGRGTSTFDGMSIARAVVEYICEKIGCKTMFATHYHELTVLENEIPGVKNYNITVKKHGNDIRFLRRIVRGPADDSYGIEVASLAGIPASVTKRARTVLRGLEEAAPDLQSYRQMNFETTENEQNSEKAGKTLQQLKELDVETLTPLEALNFLYELKKTLV